MKTLRTPDERFVDLPGYAFAPHYLEDLPGFEGLRVHYVDEGPADADHVFLCLHGEPTWAYLYRNMIGVFTGAGHRVVVPDLFGFGRSDKPVEDAVHTYGFHRDTLIRLVEALDLRGITLVCQDWGGILGLSLPMDLPDRFQRLLVMNTGIPDGSVPPGDGFLAWKAYMANTPDLDLAKLMHRAVPHLSREETAAYAAPFPDASYKAGVRRFPEIVPIAPDMEGADVGRRAIAWWSTEERCPIFMAVGMTDPVLGPPAMTLLRQILRGCPEPLEVAEAGHFVQEWGEPIARAALKAWGD